jgi:hypothetical protein
VLLDECVDRRLAREITEHDVTTAPEVGWAGVTNGDLLSRAQRSPSLCCAHGPIV